MKSIITFRCPALCSGLLSVLAAGSVAAQITSTAITDETSIVNTGGVLVSAANFGAGAVTVNGLFHGATSAAGANLSLNAGFEGPFRGNTTQLSGGMKTLMESIAGAGVLNMSITGLDVGTEYLFQAYWEHNNGQTIDVTINGVTQLAIPDEPTNGAVISFAFTATSDTLAASFDTATDNAWIQGYSLQEAVAANPELVATIPADGAEGSATADLRTTFDVLVQPGTGSVRIFRADNSLVEAIDVTDTAEPGSVLFNGNQMLISPSSPLEGGVGHYVLIDATAVTGASGNPFVGISDPTTWNFVATSLDVLSSELGVLDFEANFGINPATGVLWRAGDTYRFLFVSSQTTDATSDDIATYNSFVQGLADASTLPLGGGTWKIVGSTTSVDARTNTGTNPGVDGVGEAVLLLDSTTVLATGYADLWDGISANADLDENLQTVASTRPFTGTLADGSANVGRELGNTTDPEDKVGTGDLAKIGVNWIQDFADGKTTLRRVYALSDPLTVTGAGDDVVVTSFEAVGGGVYELSLSGQPLTSYEFASSTILDFNPGTPVENLTPGVPAVGTISGTNDRLLKTDASGNGRVRMSLSGLRNFVVARVPPPLVLLNESFDGSAGPGLPTGWSQGRNDPPDNGTSTTLWEVGTPSNVGPIPPGLPLPSGTQCVGTDIGSNYFLPTPAGVGAPITDVWLRTPVINLSSFSEATLAFQYWTGIEDVPGDLDRGSILIRDASDDSELAVLENQTIDGTTSGWQAYSMALPPAAFTASSGTIRVEFRFEADDFVSFAGWYIDDVVITAPGG